MDVGRTRLRTGLVLVFGFLLVAGLAPAAQGQSGGDNPATITVTFSNDGKTVDITSSKGLSNIIIVDCEGVDHKHELNGEIKTLTHTETFVIATVFVKSGDNSDPNGPPGAGERFDNPDATACGGANDCEGPETVEATAEDGPRNIVSWSGVDDASGYNVYRAVGAGSFVLVHNLAGNQDTEFIDEDVEAGVTYRYRVTAIIDGDETDACDTAEVTAIPDLPGMFAFALASVGGLGAYALFRRRRA